MNGILIRRPHERLDLFSHDVIEGPDIQVPVGGEVPTTSYILKPSTVVPRPPETYKSNHESSQLVLSET